MNHKILGLSAALLASVSTTASAGILVQETFETDGQGTRYTASTPFNDGGNDHWNRTDQSNISNVSGAYTALGGSFLWATEDTDDTGINGGNGADEQTLTLNTINLTGLTSNITVGGLFGAGNNLGPGSSAYDVGDYLQVWVSLDGAAAELALSFRFVNQGDDFNEPIAQDTNFDGNGDGTVLSTTLASFTSADLGSASSTIDVQVRVFADSAAEELAFDNLTVSGVPEPQSLAMLALGAMLIIRRRRR